MKTTENSDPLDLVSEYFLRDLSKQELDVLQEALQTNDEVRQAFGATARDEWLLHHVHHMDEDRIVHFKPRKNGIKRIRAIAAIVALLVSLATVFMANRTTITLMVSNDPSEAVVARVSDCYVLNGEAISVVNRGRVRKISAHSRLRNGDRVVVPPGCRLSFQYLEEETRIRLAGGSVFVLEAHDGAKHIQLSKGLLQADVAKQPKNRPMRIQTTSAEAVVLGTSFEILADGLTRLSVTSGRVEFKEENSEKSVMVQSGFLAETDGAMDVKPFNVARFQPLEDRTLNLTKDPEFIAVDPVRNYKGFLKFDLKQIKGTVIEAKLRLRVMHKQKDFGGSGHVRLFRVDPDQAGKGTREPMASYRGKVGGGMDLEFSVDPTRLSGGINAMLIALDKGGNDFWFSSSRGAVAPVLELKIVEEN